MPVTDSEDKPVVNGLVALVAVAVVVGLLAGIGALIGVKMLGVGGGNGGSNEPAAQDSLYLPKPVATSQDPDPLLTLQPLGGDSGSSSPSGSSTGKATKKPKPKREISLTQGATNAAPGQDLYLSGIYPGGEGAVLDVEIRVNGGAWTDFPVDVNVSDESFTTYVNTSQVGKVEFRLVDRARKVKSNVVKVTYG